MKAGIIILAAGASTRMGQSKQLLAWKGTTLLNHAVGIAVDSGARPVIVVLGANEKAHREAITHNVTIVSNPDWSKGMGSSLKAGIRELQKNYPAVQSVIIMVCDQPSVTAAHLRLLWSERQRSGKKAVVSKYANTLGVPALFGRKFYDDIRELGDEQGAKKLIGKLSANDRSVVELEGGEKDLDTWEEYQGMSRE
jgi:molybdenum cofactor cytidylyltransferase